MDRRTDQDGGYLFLWRKLAKRPGWLSTPFDTERAWIDLLMMASWQPRVVVYRGVQIPLDRGELSWTHSALARRWKWNRGKVRRYLENLVDEGQLRIAPVCVQTNAVNRQMNTPVNTPRVPLTYVLTIVNYDDYQASEQANEQANEHRQKKVYTEDSRDLGSESQRSLFQEEEPHSPSRPHSGSSSPPDSLLALIDMWNALPKGVVRPGNGVRRQPISKAVDAGWRRVVRSHELQEHFADLPRLRAAIVASKSAHGRGWFSLPKLLGGKNQTGEYIVERVLAGAYADDNGRARQAFGNQWEPTGETPL